MLLNDPGGFSPHGMSLFRRSTYVMNDRKHSGNKGGARRIPWAALLALALALMVPLCALAYRSDTLRSGMKSEAVKQMQEALISLGYLGGTPDGIFGTNTENAVKKFQRANGLKADGLAGTQTLALIYEKAGVTGTSSAEAASPAAQESGSPAPVSSQSTPESAPASSQSAPPVSSTEASSAGPQNSSSGASSASSSASPGSSSSLFGGNYATLRKGNSGSRVVVLQQRLIALGYLKGSADGKFGAQTRQAVISFQKANGLKADGLAGKKTLLALESGSTSGTSSASNASSQSADSSASSGGPSAQANTDSSSSGPASAARTASGPSGSQVKLLHWFNDIKPTLKSGQTLYIYEPSSGLAWNLRIYSCGRHCDAEPSTAEDTANLLKAFGGVNTWSEKAVYVKLPNGTWTVGSTHDMPHMSGSVKDNNFNGHLCVHFLRDMDEAQKNDPSYGVSNQNTIRAFWKSLTGEVIEN